MTTKYSRRCERFFDRPVQKDQALIKRGRVDSDLARPLRPRERFALKCIEFYIAGIISLLLFCGPITVSRRVIQIILTAFDGVLWRRTVSHVSEEIYKSIWALPPPTYANASSPIISPTNMVWIVTSPPNILPRPKLWDADVPHSVLRRPSADSVAATAAAARLSVARAQISYFNGGYLPTVTTASPLADFNVRGQLNYNETAKSFSS